MDNWVNKLNVHVTYNTFWNILVDWSQSHHREQKGKDLLDWISMMVPCVFESQQQTLSNAAVHK